MTPTVSAHVLVVDDDRELGELLTFRLEHHGFKVSVEHTAERGLARVGREVIDAMIVDLRLGDANGIDVLKSVRARTPDVPVIMLTAHGSIETAVEAMRHGAYGFLTKPFHDHELLQKLTHAVESSALRREVQGLRRLIGSDQDGTTLLGTSPSITRVRDIVARIAPTDATVLVLGESGTGKELVARAIHAESNRASNRLVAINCGALPPELLESELFGHVRGAFTGAVKDRPGMFAAARGGTLFLDEIGEAPMPVQVKLLRVLQERRFTRVGASEEEEADVRIIAATHRDLRDEIAQGRFREDLFYRLHVVPITTPPLRDRPEDIPLLAEVFLERAAARHHLPVPRLSREALGALMLHSWKGNVRELANVMEGALLLATATEIHAEDLRGLGVVPTGLQAPTPVASNDSATLDDALGQLFVPITELPALREAKDAFEREYLRNVLHRAAGNVSAAARMAGRNRTDFHELLRRHGLSRAPSKPA